MNGSFAKDSPQVKLGAAIGGVSITAYAAACIIPFLEMIGQLPESFYEMEPEQFDLLATIFGMVKSVAILGFLYHVYVWLKIRGEGVELEGLPLMKMRLRFYLRSYGLLDLAVIILHAVTEVSPEELGEARVFSAGSFFGLFWLFRLPAMWRMFQGVPDRRMERSAEAEDAVNDDGARVELGNGEGSNKFYCGRDLGTEAIPGSDGRCGPNNGPQCASCQRFQNQDSNVTILVSGAGHQGANGTYRRSSEVKGNKEVWIKEGDANYRIQWSTMSDLWMIDYLPGAAPYCAVDRRDETIPMDAAWVKYQGNGDPPNPSVVKVQGSNDPNAGGAVPVQAQVVQAQLVAGSTNDTGPVQVQVVQAQVVQAQPVAATAVAIAVPATVVGSQGQ